MKRLTTDNPQDNIETSLNLFYVKDHETWVRGGGTAPEYADVSLFDFTRRLVRTHIPDVELPEENDDLSMLMAEWLFDGPESAEGLIATLYAAAWAFAELRHRLAVYEDTGLEPEVCANYKTFEDEAISKGVTFKRIVELMNAGSKGRLVVLPRIPCAKPGYREGALYLIESNEVVETYLAEAIVGENGDGKIDVAYCTHDGDTFMQCDIGKTVFLSREEAEAALQG